LTNLSDPHFSATLQKNSWSWPSSLSPYCSIKGHQWLSTNPWSWHRVSSYLNWPFVELGSADFFFFFLFAVLGFELRASCLATVPAIFCVGYFPDRLLWTVCPDWPPTLILRISASWIARITSLNHWCLAPNLFLFFSFLFWQQ
jgi:hypothetical protein